MTATFARPARVRTLWVGFGALIGFALNAPPAPAQACTWCYACSPALHVPLPVAPSPSNLPGYYTWGPDGTCYGAWYGPHYYLRPPGAPFNGMLPGQAGQVISGGRPPSFGPGPMGPMGMLPMPPMNYPGMGPVMLPPNVAAPYMSPPGPQGAQKVVFPSHPHVRGPRDFFMWREEMENRAAREARPGLIP